MQEQSDAEGLDVRKLALDRLHDSMQIDPSPTNRKRCYGILVSIDGRKTILAQEGIEVIGVLYAIGLPQKASFLPSKTQDAT